MIVWNKEHQASSVESESKSVSRDVYPHPEETRGNIKKVSKRIDFVKDGKKDNSEDSSVTLPSNEPTSISRKIKNVQKHRRPEVPCVYWKPNDQRPEQPKKNPAHKGLRRVGSGTSHPREALEDVIQQVLLSTVIVNNRLKRGKCERIVYPKHSVSRNFAIFLGTMDTIPSPTFQKIAFMSLVTLMTQEQAIYFSSWMEHSSHGACLKTKIFV